MANETKELRGEAPHDLVCALDALALAADISRTAYVNRVLERHVTVELHRVSVLHKMLRGNPLLPDDYRTVSE